ncbi:MAG: hypothetical protein Q8J68_14855 [Methanolobus sp.]|uniref:hypothetical protein n=1 Tax=Methanolobus sp. TaxID=1874737 RepID=UPI00272F8CDC|nr:hypothetical protein [Methanolobus sp.]MDP2218555.1 hypothetical protein [Methanolobus sp.]
MPKVTRCPITKPIKLDRSLSLSRKIDLSKAVELRFRHALPYHLIADQMDEGCTAQAVQIALEPYEQLFKNPEEVKAYADNRVPFLTSAEKTLLFDMMKEGKRDKASLNNLAYAFRQLWEARQDLEGKRTPDVLIHISTDEEARIQDIAVAMSRRAMQELPAPIRDGENS